MTEIVPAPATHPPPFELCEEDVAQFAEELLAESLGEAGGMLIVDGSEFPKKGKHSAGVAR